MNVLMQLRRIIISEMTEPQYVELKEMDGDRRFTIVIGPYEANQIARRIRKESSVRPLPHDLLVGVIEQLGCELRDIIMSDLRDGTYYAKLRVMQDGEIAEIDCRPSDAIAMAITASVPIYVSEEVLDEASGEST